MALIRLSASPSRKAGDFDGATIEDDDDLIHGTRQRECLLA
jgi:hypothetical protein